MARAISRKAAAQYLKARIAVKLDGMEAKDITWGRFSPGVRKPERICIGSQGVGPDSNPAWLKESRIRTLGGSESHPMRGSNEEVQELVASYGSSGFEPELWLRSRLRLSSETVTRAQSIESKARLEPGG